jgi:hypothetical protein
MRSGPPRTERSEGKGRGVVGVGGAAPVQAAAWWGSRPAQGGQCERSECPLKSGWGRSPAPRPPGAGKAISAATTGAGRSGAQEVPPGGRASGMALPARVAVPEGDGRRPAGRPTRREAPL